MQTAADYMSTEISEEVKAGRAYKVPVKPPQPWSGGKVYKQKPVDSKKLDAVGKKIGAIRSMKEEAPANVTAGVAKVDPLLGKKRVLKRFKAM